LIVGDGPELRKLVDQIDELDLMESVELTGAVSPESIPGLLASMDVAVAPYPKLPHFYFSPLKVYEYMAAGLPVIASRIGLLEQVIEQGVSGWLVPPGDATALALGIQGLRASPASFRKRLGAAARCYVLQYHSWNAVAQQILELAGLEPTTEGGKQWT